MAPRPGAAGRWSTTAPASRGGGGASSHARHRHPWRPCADGADTVAAHGEPRPGGLADDGVCGRPRGRRPVLHVLGRRAEARRRRLHLRVLPQRVGPRPGGVRLPAVRELLEQARPPAVGPPRVRRRVAARPGDPIVGHGARGAHARRAAELVDLTDSRWLLGLVLPRPRGARRPMRVPGRGAEAVARRVGGRRRGVAARPRRAGRRPLLPLRVHGEPRRGAHR
mmetsp:Transcript_41387/g.117078  ORF Transcript_41387/g.117078 Transcript_41387/m.117078 type:complete len:224 (+) Transcript_41387:199-870(+)